MYKTSRIVHYVKLLQQLHELQLQLHLPFWFLVKRLYLQIYEVCVLCSLILN